MIRLHHSSRFDARNGAGDRLLDVSTAQLAMQYQFDAFDNAICH
jgi:hypothetical protein